MLGQGIHSEAAEGHLSWLRLGRAVETCDPLKTCSRTGQLKRPCEGSGWPGCLESGDHLGPCSSRPVEVWVSFKGPGGRPGAVSPEPTAGKTAGWLSVLPQDPARKRFGPVPRSEFKAGSGDCSPGLDILMPYSQW